MCVSHVPLFLLLLYSFLCFLYSWTGFALFMEKWIRKKKFFLRVSAQLSSIEVFSYHEIKLYVYIYIWPRCLTKWHLWIYKGTTLQFHWICDVVQNIFICIWVVSVVELPVIIQQSEYKKERLSCINVSGFTILLN